MTLAFNMDKITKDLKKTQNVVLPVWVGVQFFWFLVLEAYTWFKEFDFRKCCLSMDKCWSNLQTQMRSPSRDQSKKRMGNMSVQIHCNACSCLCKIGSSDDESASDIDTTTIERAELAEFAPATSHELVNEAAHDEPNQDEGSAPQPSDTPTEGTHYVDDDDELCLLADDDEILIAPYDQARNASDATTTTADSAREVARPVGRNQRIFEIVLLCIYLLCLLACAGTMMGFFLKF